LDAFHIQNFIGSDHEKPLFYIHVNNIALTKEAAEHILEVNGSYEPTKFRAKLF